MEAWRQVLLGDPVPLVVLEVSSSCHVVIGLREGCVAPIGHPRRPAGLSCVVSCIVKEINCNVPLHEVNLFSTNML